MNIDNIHSFVVLLDNSILYRRLEPHTAKGWGGRVLPVVFTQD